MRLIKPLKHQVTPPSWNYAQNNRGILPLNNDMQVHDNAVTTPNTNSEMEPVSASPTPQKAVPPTVMKNIVLTQEPTRTTAPEIASSKKHLFLC